MQDTYPAVTNYTSSSMPKSGLPSFSRSIFIQYYSIFIQYRLSFILSLHFEFKFPQSWLCFDTSNIDRINTNIFAHSFLIVTYNASIRNPYIIYNYYKRTNKGLLFIVPSICTFFSQNMFFRPMIVSYIIKPL